MNDNEAKMEGHRNQQVFSVSDESDSSIVSSTGSSHYDDFGGRAESAVTSVTDTKREFEESTSFESGNLPTSPAFRAVASKSPGQKIRESIARAKQGKDSGDVATLFFNTGRTTKTNSEEVGSSYDVFRAAGMANEDNDNSRSTNGENPSHENAAALSSLSGIVEARTSGKSDDMSKTTAPTIKSSDFSTDNTTGPLFRSVRSDRGSSDSDSDDSSSISTGTIEKERSGVSLSSDDNTSDSDYDSDSGCSSNDQPGKIGNDPSVGSRSSNDYTSGSDSDYDSDSNGSSNDSADPSGGSHTSNDYTSGSDSDYDSDADGSPNIPAEKVEKVPSDDSLSGNDSPSDSEDSDSECSSKILENIERNQLEEQTEDSSTTIDPQNSVAAATIHRHIELSGHDSNVNDSIDAMGSIRKNQSSNKSDNGSIDDPEAFFANISKARKGLGSRTSKPDSNDSPNPKKNNEAIIDDPETFFAKISKARKGPGISHYKPDANVDSTAKENNERSIDDPEAFFASISKARNRIRSKKSTSDLRNISKAESDGEPIDGPEEFSVDNLTAKIDFEGQNFKLDSDRSLRVRRLSESRDGPINDSDKFYANNLYARECSRSKHSKVDDSSKDGNRSEEKEEPAVNLEENLGDSYELFLAGLSNGKSSDVVPTAEIQQTDVATDNFDKQRKSNICEEEEIVFLHEEMKKIGISPTVLVSRDDPSMRSGSRSSLGEDSYLEDLLQQREEREDVHREEIMEETVKCYEAMDEPKSEQLFLEILEEVTKQKQEEFAERDVVQDKLISKELEFRKQQIKKTSVCGNKPNEQQRDDTKYHPEDGRALVAQSLNQGEEDTTLVRKQKQKQKRKSVCGNEPNEQRQDDKKNHPDGGRALVAQNPNQGEKDTTMVRKQKKKNKGSKSTKDRSPDKSELKRAAEKESNTLTIARINDDIEFDGNNEARTNNDIESGPKRKAALPTVAESVFDTMPEELSSSSSSSSSSSVGSYSLDDRSQLSINGFEDEYYYDEERAMMDRKAISLLREEARLSQQEFNLTKKMMLASTCMCCLAFGLILVFILDPLDRRSLFNKH